MINFIFELSLYFLSTTAVFKRVNLHRTNKQLSTTQDLECACVFSLIIFVTGFRVYMCFFVTNFCFRWYYLRYNNK